MSWGQDEEAVSEVTINQLELKAKQIADVRDEIASSEEVTKNLNARKRELEAEMQALLSQAGKTSYQARVGTVSITTRESVTIPREVEDKQKLFDYLASQGIFMEVVGVNHQTLQSLWKTARKEAEEKGDYNFRLPGVGDPTTVEIVSFRRRS